MLEIVYLLVVVLDIAGDYKVLAVEPSFVAVAAVVVAAAVAVVEIENELAALVMQTLQYWAVHFR